MAEGSVWKARVSLRVLVWLPKSAFLSSTPWSTFLGVRLDSTNGDTQRNCATEASDFQKYAAKKDRFGDFPRGIPLGGANSRVVGG